MLMLRPLVVILLLLGAGSAAVSYYPPARSAAFFLMGKSEVCSLREAWEAPKHLDRQIREKDRILAASRKLEVDAKGYERWSTPDGEYWIPKGSHYVLPFNLAEQARDIYSVPEVHIQTGDVVLDCGANIGVFTRQALNKGAAKVIAIEPAPENLECLRRNFPAEIAAGKVVVRQDGH
jgi:hypothetical protein